MPLFLLQSPADFSTPIMLAVVFAIFYFILIRPQQRERKKQEAMRAAVKKGDRVLTQAGILARVQQVKDNEVVLDLDGSARMTIVKAAIQTVYVEGGAAEGTEAKAGKNGKS